jgi:hypothetical protein
MTNYRVKQQMIINEWQLNSKLNMALQQTQRADFSLYLALMSPAVDEYAQFFTPDAANERVQQDLFQQLGTKAARNVAMEKEDILLLLQHSEALQKGGLAQLKLTACLNVAPLALHNDKKRLNSDVWQNLDLHCRRRLMQNTPVKAETDPAALFDILHQLHGIEAA